MRRYSDMFVQCDDDEVQKLYWLITIFLAKCDGLISGSDVLELQNSTKGISAFSPYITSVGSKERIVTRLKSLRRYGITKPKEIIRLLTLVSLATDKPVALDRKYLVEFGDNAGKPFKWFSKRLNVSVSSVLRAYRRLRNRIQFAFGNHLNYPLFRLKHFVLFFKPNEYFSSSLLYGREFTTSVNCDAFGDWMWASFVIPNQSRIIREFVDGIRKLADGMISDSRLYEVKSVGKHYDLSMFDGAKWFFSEETLSIGAFKFAEAGKGILDPMRIQRYADKPMRFDRIDFLIACRTIPDALARNADIRNTLKKSGYNLSQVTVSKRMGSLRRKGAFFPYSSFRGLDLNVTLVFAIECDNEVLETFYRMFSLLPDCHASGTNKGVIFSVRTTAEMSPAILYLMQSLRDEVHHMIAASRFENLGSQVSIDYRHWADEKQYWDYERGFFDLSKLLHSRLRSTASTPLCRGWEKTEPGKALRT